MLVLATSFPPSNPPLAHSTNTWSIPHLVGATQTSILARLHCLGSSFTSSFWRRGDCRSGNGGSVPHATCYKPQKVAKNRHNEHTPRTPPKKENLFAKWWRRRRRQQTEQKQRQRTHTHAHSHRKSDYCMPTLLQGQTCMCVCVAKKLPKNSSLLRCSFFLWMSCELWEFSKTKAKRCSRQWRTLTHTWPHTHRHIRSSRLQG